MPLAHRCNKCQQETISGRFCSHCGQPLVLSSSTASGTSSALAANNQIKSSKVPCNKFGGGDKCHKCQQTVYSAEKCMAAGYIFHDACLTCATCNTRVSSTNMTDRDGVIYCQTCYGKGFGPKGFGIGNHNVYTQ